MKWGNYSLLKPHGLSLATGFVSNQCAFPLDIMKYIILLCECQPCIVVWSDYYTAWGVSNTLTLHVPSHKH